MRRAWFSAYDENVDPELNFPQVPMYEVLRETAEKHPDKLRKMMTEMVDELTKMKALYPVKEGKVLKPVIPGA